MPDITESRFKELANQFLQREIIYNSSENLREIIESATNTITLLDRENGIGEHNLSNRNKIGEVNKNLVLKVWLKLLEARIYDLYIRRHRAAGILAESLGETIERVISQVTDGLSYYEFQNQLLLYNELQMAFGRMGNDHITFGLNEGAKIMYIHKMMARTRFRFFQAKFRKGVFRKTEALAYGCVLLFLWWSSKFGESPFLFARANAIVVIVFGIIFAYWGNFESLIFLPASLDWQVFISSQYISLVTLFNLDALQPRPLDSLTSILMLLESLIGYVFLALLIAMITKRIVR